MIPCTDSQGIAAAVRVVVGDNKTQPLPFGLLEMGAVVPQKLLLRPHPSWP